MPWPQTKDQERPFVLYEHTARTSCSGAAVSLISSGRSLIRRRREENELSAVALVTENVRHEFVHLSREITLILLSEQASSPSFLRRCLSNTMAGAEDVLHPKMLPSWSKKVQMTLLVPSTPVRCCYPLQVCNYF